MKGLERELILVSGDKFRIFVSGATTTSLLTELDLECIGVGYLPRQNLFVISENTLDS